MSKGELIRTAKITVKLENSTARLLKTIKKSQEMTESAIKTARTFKGLLEDTTGLCIKHKQESDIYENTLVELIENNQGIIQQMLSDSQDDSVQYMNLHESTDRAMMILADIRTQRE